LKRFSRFITQIHETSNIDDQLIARKSVHFLSRISRFVNQMSLIDGEMESVDHPGWHSAFDSGRQVDIIDFMFEGSNNYSNASTEIEIAKCIVAILIGRLS
jgi:hypothetical protein